jgi:DNA invertase Pin-like site-specific DNA recombinase
MLIGYARVSTTDQDTALQLAALRKAGVAPRRIREETASGAGPRVVLEQLLRDLRPGDEVIVYKLDRLARGVRDLLRIVDAIDEAGASFRSITEAIDTGKPAGKLALAMLGAVGEFERDLIKERAAAGFAAARARGVHIG